MRARDLCNRVFCALRRQRAHVGEHERHRSRRKFGTPPAAQSRDERRGGRIAALRIRGQAAAHHPLQRRNPCEVDRSPAGLAPGRRFAGEQRHRSGGERVDVRCHRRSPAGGDLRCDVPGGARPTQIVGRRGRQSEVDEHDPSGRGEDEVRRLDVSMDDGRIVSVQVLQGLGGFFEVADQAKRVETGVAVDAEQRLQIGAVDPVHRDDVAIVDEEVLTHEREPRMRREREEEPRLREEMRARRVVRHRPDLQCDLPAVEVIERPDHLALSTSPDDFERLVPLAQELGLHAISRWSAGRPASPPRGRPPRSRAGRVSALRARPRRTCRTGARDAASLPPPRRRAPRRSRGSRPAR